MADRCKQSGKYKHERLNKQEIAEWTELYEYVKTKVMGYDELAKLDRTMIARLRGLRYGKLYDNTRSKNEANYPFSVILYTFKACAPVIQRALQTKYFNSEQGKLNYITAIVERNLNDVYLRLKSAQKIENQIQEAEAPQDEEYVNRFRAKEHKENHKLDDLW